MKHQDFRGAAIAEAFDAIEASILPSLTRLIDSAADAEPGIDAAARADELRTLARELGVLTSLATIAARVRQTAPDPFSTDE